MTIEELINELQEFAEAHGPQTEVRMMTQPNWPLDATVCGVWVKDPVEEIEEERAEMMAEAETDEDREEIAEEMNRQIDAAGDPVLFVLEGSHVGYGSSAPGTDPELQAIAPAGMPGRCPLQRRDHMEDHVTELEPVSEWTWELFEVSYTRTENGPVEFTAFLVSPTRT